MTSVAAGYYKEIRDEMRKEPSKPEGYSPGDQCANRAGRRCSS